MANVKDQSRGEPLLWMTKESFEDIMSIIVLRRMFGRELLWELEMYRFFDYKKLFLNTHVSMPFCIIVLCLCCFEKNDRNHKLPPYQFDVAGVFY